MPRIIQTPKKITHYNMRIRIPEGGGFEKAYKDMNQMEKWKKYYENKGYKVRKI